MEFLSHNELETEQIGAALAKRLSPNTVLAYRGGLGMGKTAFTRGLTRGLGCSGRVTSPTFTIVKEYEGPVPLFHFDMYRIGDEDDLYSVGFYDYLSHGICLCEWSENIPYALPELSIKTDIARTNIDTPDERRISVCVVQNDAHLDG